MGVVSCGTTMLDQGVFENIGAVTWDTTVKTSGFTAVSGNGYFCNTTSAAFTVTLPASPSAGDIVGIKDYANTADTNNITIGRNSSNIQGEAADFIIDTEGRSVLLVYVDATKGWLVTSASQASDIAIPPSFITATGGTITTSGDCKIHTFTGPGTFCVSGVSCCASNNQISYMVVAGAGGGGGSAVSFYSGGGGGAGGFREDKSPVTPYTASPLDGAGPITVSATSYPITVGAGGGGGGGSPGPAGPGSRTPGGNGNPSTFSTITSAGGGGGSESGSAGGVTPVTAASGGSGGGGGGYNCSPTGGGGTGNTPPVSPPQGNNGGPGYGPSAGYGGGGGGAGGAGEAAPTVPAHSAVGGVGVASEITASSVTRAIGGDSGSPPSSPASAGAANTGNAGPGGNNVLPGDGGAGGSGIVIIRYKYQ